MERKNKVTVRIYNREYTVVATENVDYIHKVADYINKIMCGILIKHPSMSYSMAAILSAINAADDYHKALLGVDKLYDENRETAKELADLKAEFERLKEINARLQAALDNKTNGFSHDKRY